MNVNVYEVSRNYGGPEEGGWWYDTGHCVETRRCATRADAERVQAALRDEYPRTGRRSSVLGGDDYEVVIEDGPGRDYPEHRPHYE